MKRRINRLGIIFFSFLIFPIFVYHYLPVEYQVQIKKIILYSNSDGKLYIQEGKKIIYKAYPYAKKDDKKYQTNLYQIENDAWSLILQNPNVGYRRGLLCHF